MAITKYQVFENKAITAAATADSTMVPVRGAGSIHFLFISSASEVFAAADAFQILIRTETNETIIAPTTATKHAVTVGNAADLNGAAANAGIIINIYPTDWDSIVVKEIGCRVKAGAVDMTDVDCFAYVDR